MKPAAKWFIAYGIKLLGIYLAFYVLYKLISFFNGFYFMKAAEAQMIYYAMKPFYPLITINGNAIGNLVIAGNYSNFHVSIDDLCLGWFPLAGFASMILALPRIQNRKIANCLLLGVPVLFVANLLRIIIVIFAGAISGIGAFEFFHLVVLKFDLMVLIIIMFLVCIKWVVGKEALAASVKSFSYGE